MAAAGVGCIRLFFIYSSGVHILSHLNEQQTLFLSFGENLFPCWTVELVASTCPQQMIWYQDCCCWLGLYKEVSTDQYDALGLRATSTFALIFSLSCQFLLLPSPPPPPPLSSLSLSVTLNIDLWSICSHSADAEGATETNWVKGGDIFWTRNVSE